MSILKFGFGILLGSLPAFIQLPAQVPVGVRAIQVRPVAPQSVAQESRMALVIGNGAYAEAPLRNPVNDAQAMKRVLESSKFQVTLLTNGSKREMENAIRDFGDRIRNGSVALFYFAGHGVQVKGVNYLVPVGADVQREDEVPYQTVEAGLLLDKMETAKNKLNIVILDACRNNPFARSWRTLGDKGLAQVKAPTGTMVAYSTGPGSIAADGSAEHGLYTQALLEEIKEPGLNLEEVFKKVREKVLESSKGGQTPWESNSTVGDFYFHPMKSILAGPSEAELEATYWEGIQNSQDAKDFKTFLVRFPSGAHAELASLKMKRLMAPAPCKAATLPSPSPPITPVPENQPQQTQTKAVQTQNETVYVTKTGKKFHRAGCPSLRYSEIAMKRWEAIAKGYTPCKICNP